MNYVLKAQNDFDLSIMDLLTSNIENLDKEISQKLGQLHNIFRGVIERLVERVTYNDYDDLNNYCEGIDNRRERNIVGEIIDADRQSYLSGKKITLIVDTISKICKDFCDKAENAKKDNDSRQMTRLAISNAVLIYETHEFVLKQYTNFQVGGIEQLEEIDKKLSKYHTDAIEEGEKLLRDIEDSGVDDKKERQRMVQQRLEVLRALQNRWGTYLLDKNAVCDQLRNAVKNAISSVKLSRDDARHQMNTLSIVLITGSLMNSVKTLTQTHRALTSLPQVPITVETLNLFLRADEA